MGGSIIRPKTYLFKKDKNVGTSVNINEFEVKNRKNEENEVVFRKDRKVVTKKNTEVNNIENDLNKNKQKLIQDFNDSCINIMLSNRMARKR